MVLMEGTNGETTETSVEKILVEVSSIDQPKIREAQSELDGFTLQNIGSDSNKVVENQIVRAPVTTEQQTSLGEATKHNDIFGNSGLVLTCGDSLMHNSIIKWNQESFLLLPGPPVEHTSSFNLGGTNGNLPTNILSVSQASGPPTGGNYIYVNVKQYKRIIRRRKIRKFKNAKRGKLAALLPKPIPQAPDKAREGEQNLRPAEIPETIKRFDNIRDIKGKEKTNNSRVIDTVEDGLPNNYSPTRTPMTWYPDIFVNDLVAMKERVWALEERSQIESITLKRVTEDNWKLATEVKSLREQIQKLQFNMEKGEYELILLKKEVGEKRTAASTMGEGEPTEGDKNPQMKNIQDAIANMEIKENQLREQIEEVRSWANIVKGPTNTSIDNIEKQVRS